MKIDSLPRRPVTSPEHFYRLTRHLHEKTTTDRIIAHAYDARYRHLTSMVLARRTSIFGAWMLPRILEFAGGMPSCERISVCVCRPYQGAGSMPAPEDYRCMAHLGRELSRAGLHFVDLMIRSRTGYWSAYESGWFSASCIDLLNSLAPSESMSTIRTS